LTLQARGINGSGEGSIMTSNDRLQGGRRPDVPDETSLSQPRDEDLVAQFTLDYLDVLNGSRDDLPSLDDLAAGLQRRVLQAWSNIDRLVIGEPLPPLSSDPTAIALGVVPVTLLDPTAVRQSRQAKDLRPSDVAASLHNRGWPVTTAEVFAWERRPERVAAALLTDLAAILKVPAATIAIAESETTPTEPGSNAPDSMATFLQVLYSDDLDEIVSQWARLLGLDQEGAREDLQRRLSGAAYRGTRALDTHQWKAILAVLLASERARRRKLTTPQADG
jgi:hypothetical protein